MTQTSRSVSLAVWPCAQRSRREQRSRYLTGSSCRPGELLPALARRAIDTYSDPGDLVVDPCCASGTALVEAVRLDRDALGVEADRACADAAAANIENTRSDGAPGRARVLTGDGRDLPRILARREARELLGPPGDDHVARLPHATATLVLTALPSARPATLAQYATAAVTVVKPGGFVVLVIDRRRAGSRLASELVQLLQQHGLLYWQHVVALVAEIRGDQLRCRRRRTRPAAVTTCHEDVLVFRRPEEVAR